VEFDLLKYFITQGPFAVLFVWLFIHSNRRNEKREADYRREIIDMRNEMRVERDVWRQERSIWSETLNKFSEKYEIVITELRDIKDRITTRM
jgi:hypothetical protein